uniref:T9SS type A sorting domain-containing protein n=1 Tax=candidate division WOR-3 bacterium TaxID=2052148 RepID=A0A7C6EAU8_UNCW3
MKHRGKTNFLERKFVSIFGFYSFSALENVKRKRKIPKGAIPIFVVLLSLTPLEIINRKSKVSKSIVSIVIFLVFLTGFAQETHNLEIIWTIPGNPVLCAFGFNLTSGDVDNDGHPDIIVSADTYTAVGTTPYLGRAYLYYGNGIGDTVPDVVLKSPFAKGTTPTRVHSADINGDNFDDIIIGEANANEGFGGITIFWGGNPVDTVPDIILPGRRPQDGFFGVGLASGDVNGDSYSDLIVGAYGTAPMPGGFLMGRVYIYFGGPNFDTIPDVILNGGHEGDDECFGCTVGGGGDVNSDGFEDVIIGAYQYGTSTWGDGRIYIYLGGSPMDTIFDVAMIGEYPNQNLGLAGLGLITNNFDYDHAVFGDPFWPLGSMNRGKVYVLFGGNPMDSIPDVWMIGRIDTSWLGTWTASAGNLNLDNCDEIISGAPWEGYLKGAAYVWLGGNLLDTTPDAWIKGVQYDDDIGRIVASAGDVDGDGKDEIMVSNYASDYTPKRVWVCKYTGPGTAESRLPFTAFRRPPEVKPNPARSVIRVRCSLPVKNIRIYDITGKIIKTIDVSKKLETGQYVIKWDLRDDNQKKVATGVYFIEVTINAVSRNAELREIRKITVVK